MTNQEIIDYFAPNTVYQFAGNLAQLQDLMVENNTSYNCIRLGDERVFFSSTQAVTDPRITVISQGNT